MSMKMVKEVEEAASCLLQMKQANLDPKTDKELRYLMKQYENENEIRNRKGKEPLGLMDRNYRKRKRTNYEQFFNSECKNNKKSGTTGRFDPSWIPTRRNQKSPPQSRDKGKTILLVTNENENEAALLKPDPKYLKKLPDVRKAIGIDGDPLPGLPSIHSLQGQIGQCSTPFEKQLTISDLKRSQARLALCKDAVEKNLYPLMNTEEISELASQKSLEVTVYDRMGREYEMYFKLWAGKMHVISGKWNEFCSDNQLKAHEDWVIVWMFRHKEKSGKLCFTIMSRRFKTENLIGKTQKNGNKIKEQEED